MKINKNKKIKWCYELPKYVHKSFFYSTLGKHLDVMMLHHSHHPSMLYRNVREIFSDQWWATTWKGYTRDGITIACG